MKSILLSSAIVLGLAGMAQAEPVKYNLDASHSQVIFNYNHLGLSTTYGMFSGFEGVIMFDAENPENSSVTASLPTAELNTGWAARDKHLLSPDFFNAEASPTVTFTSTGIEVTGENTALITGDLSLNGATLPVVLDTTLNASKAHPMAGKAALGFDAVATINRSEFGMGIAIPNVSDAVSLVISIEALAAE